MKYISIDIETTGLNPSTSQILEFAAVVEDTAAAYIPVESLAYFRRVVDHDILGEDNNDNIYGAPFALQRNAKLLLEIAESRTECKNGGIRRDQHVDTLITMCKDFKLFLDSLDTKEPLVIAGKNFGSFDWQFLERAFRIAQIRISHRFLDPAILYTNFSMDMVLPDMNECLKRAGYNNIVKHEALQDARDVIYVLRNFYAND